MHSGSVSAREFDRLTFLLRPSVERRADDDGSPMDVSPSPFQGTCCSEAGLGTGTAIAPLGAPASCIELTKRLQYHKCAHRAAGAERAQLGACPNSITVVWKNAYY